MNLSRRDFLKTGIAGLTYFSMAATVPSWISKSAYAIANSAAGDHIFVIVQLAGGNDGLNTVIPYTDEIYNGIDLRPNLHIVSGLEGTTLDSLNAFHPKLVRLAEWFKDGKLAIVQNVGYPNPDLSHFIATDFWEFGTSPGSRLTSTEGWIGRYIDNACEGVPPENFDPLTMLGAGMFLVPKSLGGSELYTPPAVPEFEFYKMFVPGGVFGEHIQSFVGQLNNASVIDPNVDFLQRSSNLAQASVEDMAMASLQPILNAYPTGSLGKGLDMVSKVIRAGFPTQVFYVSQGGYDTHANQYGGNAGEADPTNLGDHQRLLNDLDQALDAFLLDMESSGNLNRVVVMTFSEFGRRVAENDSKGTDHGTASNLFVVGGPVTGGVFGGQPDLADLISGNLRHRIDFRSVYSRVLRDWLGTDPEPIFGSADFNDPILNIQGGMEEAAFLPERQLGPLEGDVNNDGLVNSSDVQFVINDAIRGTNTGNTDINLDGRVDAVDLQLVINAALKK